LDDAVREAFGMPMNTTGVLVTGVDVSSEAYAKGLREGDLLTEAGQKKLIGVADLQERLSEAKAAGRKSILLLVRTNGDPRFVALSVE
jgi:serine protease Do